MQRFFPTFPPPTPAGATRRRFLGYGGATALLALSGSTTRAQSPIQAQTWPERQLTIVVPYPAGGGTDVVSRMLAAFITNDLGKPIVIENRPGASATIGVRRVVQAEPDGYTVVMFTDVSTVTAASGDTTIDMTKDLSYIGQVVSVPLILVANGKAPFKTFPEFVAYAKANPGKLTAASIGPTSTHHLGLEWLKSLLGIDMLVVPYRGVAPGLTALVAGEIQLMFMGSGVADAYVANGQLNYLGVGSKTRMKKLPNVPSLSEFNLPDLELVSWYGMAAPAHTPQPVVDRWAKAIEAALADPATHARVAATGADPAFIPAAEFTRKVQAEIAKFSKIGRDAGMWK